MRWSTLLTALRVHARVAAAPHPPRVRGSRVTVPPLFLQCLLCAQWRRSGGQRAHKKSAVTSSAKNAGTEREHSRIKLHVFARACRLTGAHKNVHSRIFPSPPRRCSHSATTGS